MTTVRIGALAAAVLAACLSPSVCAAATAQWTLSETAPGVTVRHGGAVLSAVRGLRLSPGDVIETGANSRAVIVSGESYAMVAPGSRLEVAAQSAEGGFWQFFERMGEVVFSVKKASTPHFGVRTPYLAAVVKGTTFSVAVDEHKATVQVIEGAVEVDTVQGAIRRLLHAGGVARVFARHMGAVALSAEPVDALVRAVGRSGAAAPQVSSSAMSQALEDIDVRARVDRLVDRMGVEVPILQVVLTFFLTFGGTLGIGAVVGLVVALTVSRMRLRGGSTR